MPVTALSIRAVNSAHVPLLEDVGVIPLFDWMVFVAFIATPFAHSAAIRHPMVGLPRSLTRTEKSA